MNELRLGCFLPQGWRGDLPARIAPQDLFESLVGVAVRAERSGYDAVWVYDHLQGVFPADLAPVLDPVMSLTAVAWATTRVRLGSMCFAIPLHNPAVLAHQLACLDVLSHGRLDVALGAGSDSGEARAFGITVPRLRERIMGCGEAAELLRACWGHEVTHFEGRYSVVDNARIYPKPIQRPFPPIWIAGGGERLTLWQVARHGDGCSLFGPPSRVARKLDILAEHCRSLGRSFSSVRVAVVLDCLLADTDAQADLLVERHNRHREDPRSYRARRLVGSPAACAQQLQAYVDLGVSEVCCYFPDAVTSDGPERLARAVLGPGD